MKTFENEIEWTQIDNDVNGNPRYVCHYLNFNTHVSVSYDEALTEARKLGGRKFHNKQYGGGIVFQSYNLGNTTEMILKSTGLARECRRPPTKGELKQGYGATHYKTFLYREIRNKDGAVKKWFKCPVDGLRYSTQ